MKHSGQKQLEEERIYFPPYNSLLSKSSEDRNLEAGADAEAVEKAAYFPAPHFVQFAFL